MINIKFRISFGRRGREFYWEVHTRVSKFLGIVYFLSWLVSMWVFILLQFVWISYTLFLMYDIFYTHTQMIKSRKGNKRLGTISVISYI